MAEEYKLFVECGDVSLEVRLNDAVVFASAEGARTRDARIDQWVTDGRNAVRVRVAPPRGAPQPPPEAFATVVISAAAAPVYNFSWRPGRPPRPLPLTSAGAFQSADARGAWAWQGAPAGGPPTPAEREQINGLLARLHRALDAGDLEAAAGLFRLKAEEQARAFGMPLDVRLAAQRETFAVWFGQRGWGMEPIDYERLAYEAQAQGRLVVVRYADGSEVLRSKPNEDGEVVSFPLVLSRVGGGWAVVR
jgi:hypothetical protein